MSPSDGHSQSLYEEDRMAKRQYEVVKMTKGGGSVIWSGGCRNCAYMIADATKRDYPEAHVYVR